VSRIRRLTSSIPLVEPGFIIGCGLLLDTFVVRTLVIPALFALIGPDIWWPTDPANANTSEQQDNSMPQERSWL